MPENILLEDLEIYQLALEIGDDVWRIGNKWEYFEKKTIGSQLANAADSIAANIAEGYGRYTFQDRKVFCYYSRGSLLETKTWLTKAFKRNLITIEVYNVLIEKLKSLHLRLNTYIKKLKQSIANGKE